jgi:hypothetical protein
MSSVFFSFFLAALWFAHTNLTEGYQSIKGYFS